VMRTCNTSLQTDFHASLVALHGPLWASVAPGWYGNRQCCGSGFLLWRGFKSSFQKWCGSCGSGSASYTLKIRQVKYCVPWSSRTDLKSAMLSPHSCLSSHRSLAMLPANKW
jgi:hypothetical protein